MSQNFLYMFQILVDDLLITRPNCCAPDEYPVTVEITFRSCVFLTISDHEYGECVEKCGSKCCKCCLFPLDAPVTEKDRLLVNIYKKRNGKCKFLVGSGELPIKQLFDKVTESFNADNSICIKTMQKQIANLNDPKLSLSEVVTDCNQCGECDLIGRPEQFCPAHALTKHLLPVFNMKGLQTGNLTLIIRLICNGPAIVSSYAYSKVCKGGCPPPGGLSGGLGKCCNNENNHLSFSNDSDCCSKENTADGGKCANSMMVEISKPNLGGGSCGYCVQKDPCMKTAPKRIPCQRYFACNIDKGCPCSDCEDDFDRECPTGCEKKLQEQRQKEETCSWCPSSVVSSSENLENLPSSSAANKEMIKKCDICEFTKGDNNYCCDNCKTNLEDGKEKALQKLRRILEKYCFRD